MNPADNAATNGNVAHGLYIFPHRAGFAVESWNSGKLIASCVWPDESAAIHRACIYNRLMNHAYPVTRVTEAEGLALHQPELGQ